MPTPKVRKVGIIMNGVTGRMGANQHLKRSILAIVGQGGVKMADGGSIVPDPVLVGRDAAKLEQLAAATGIEKWTTDLDTALSDPHNIVYFDAQVTSLRYPAVLKAIEAGKHVYCEKPLALCTKEAYELYVLAKEAGVKHGIVQDKLWLPGIRKLHMLIKKGFFGTIYSVRGEFGYWVFEGDVVKPQRPSWNYRKEQGGGIILDMFCHWRYLLDDLFGNVRSVSCLGTRAVSKRWDEQGQPYDCSAEDGAYATFELDGGVIAQINCSWAVRVRRDDLLTLQVDGSEGSAVAGLHNCYVQSRVFTPRLVWNPDIESPNDYYKAWVPVPDYGEYDNAFKAQWELFLRHVVCDELFPWNFLEGAKGVQLAELAYESWERRAWVKIPPLDG